MKKKLIALAMLAGAGLASQGSAQVAPVVAPPTVTAPNAVYVELLGNALLYSVNYDRRFTPRIAGRVGIMALGAADDESSAAVVAAPLTVSYLSGGPNSHFEAGLGLTLASGAIEGVEGHDDEAFSGAIGTGILGYRYQRPGGGFVFRAALTPMFNTRAIAPWFGVSFGYAF